MWAIIDQVFSSGTNFVPSLLLARFLGPSSYGTFSLAFLAWFLTLALLRSAFMQPFTLRAAGLPVPEWRDLTAQTSGIVISAGCTTAVCFGLAGVVLGLSTELGRSLLAIAILAPGLALQEFWRVASFSAQRARTAAFNDLLWALGLAIAFLILFLGFHVTAASSLLAWGAGAWFAAGLGLLQLRVKPRMSRTTAHTARELVRVGGWFSGANGIFSAGMFGVAAIVAVVAGNHDLGLFRMVQGNLFGPVQIVIIAAESVFMPHLVRAIRATSISGLRESLYYSLLITAAVGAYGLALQFCAPYLLLHVVGASYLPAVVLIFPMLIAFMLDAIGDGANVLLRARARGQVLVIMQIVAAATRLLAVLLLAHADGLVGAAWGLAAGSGIGTMVSWIAVLWIAQPSRNAVVVANPARIAGLCAARLPGGSRRLRGTQAEPGASNV